MFQRYEEFETAYEQYSPAIEKYFSVCFGLDTAEELTQQLFLKVWTYLLAHPSFVPNDWKPWLFRIAVNLKNDHIRFMKKLPQNFSLLEEADSYSDPGFTQEFTQNIVDGITVRTALLRLSEQDRDLILLRYMGFDSYEIGKLMQVSPSTVRSKMTAAKKRFQKELQK